MLGTADRSELSRSVVRDSSGKLHDDEVELYDCVVDHFKQKRMLVVYEDEQFVASTSIPLDRLQENNAVQAFDLGICPPCFAETDYMVNKYDAYTKYYEVTAPRFCCFVG